MSGKGAEGPGFLVQILLPLADNAGRRFGRELYEPVFAELASRFGGSTAYSRAPAEGTWMADGTRAVTDDVIVVEVMTREPDRRWWSEYRRHLERVFRQNVIVIRALPMLEL